MIKEKRQTFWLNYLRPKKYLKSIDEVNFQTLYNNGIRTVVCDLDNTLVPSFKKWPFKATMNLIQKVKNLGMDFYIVSNNTNKRVKEFVKKLETVVKIDGYLGNAWKPFLFKFSKFMKFHNIKASQTVIIGDQFITDIWLSNRIQAENILVLPITDSSGKGLINYILYWLEKYIYHKMAHENIFANNEKNKVEEIELL